MCSRPAVSPEGLEDLSALAAPEGGGAVSRLAGRTLHRLAADGPVLASLAWDQAMRSSR